MAIDDPYARGHAAGEIAARLKDHDEHLSRINGSMDNVAGELAKMNLNIQRLADSAESDRKTTVTTAAALKDADEARRDSAESHWSPVTKIIAVLMVLIGIAAVLSPHLH